MTLISSLQNELKNVKREKQFLENIVLKQEKSINNLQNKITKYDKQWIKKNEELLIKDDTINELKEKIEELIANNKNIKNNIKINEKNEIIKMNDIINNLKNELEIKDKKMELNEVKYNNLQIKYLKMVHKKKQTEQDNLLIESIRQVRNKKKENTLRKTNSNKINNIDNLNIDENMILPLLKDKNISKTIKIIEEEQIKKENKGDKKELYTKNNIKEI